MEDGIPRAPGWSTYDEERLKQARKAAGWRWIGYIGVVLGLVFAAAGLAQYADAKAECEEQAGPFERCEGNPAIHVGPGLAFFVLGLIVALPAEKAAKEAKRLRSQKLSSDP